MTSPLKLAYVHVLPLEYYPPAINALTHFSRHAGWQVRAWSTANERGLPAWSEEGVKVERPPHAHSSHPLARRSAGYAAWHLRTALSLRDWKPDVILAVEPHSSLALWLYYTAFRGGAPLFLHHHEYYSEADYARPGMRLLRIARRIERDSLLSRAVWVSQTNPTRLELFRESQPAVRPAALRVLPNYPPEEWVSRGRAILRHIESGPTRLIYVGAASFEDTFIREAAEWVALHPQSLTLHVVGDNIARDVWNWLESLGADNISLNRDGVSYDKLPELLSRFDVGLVLYKGNTLNFVHNVPNKAVEYLACGLEVWYPPEMDGMRNFDEQNPSARTRQLNFRSLPEPGERVKRIVSASFPFTAEAALAPLVRSIEEAAQSE